LEVNKLRCWPGCWAQVVSGWPVENVGKTIKVLRADPNLPGAWEYEGWLVAAFGPNRATSAMDCCLVPLNPPPGDSVDEREVRDLYASPRRRKRRDQARLPARGSVPHGQGADRPAVLASPLVRLRNLAVAHPPPTPQPVVFLHC
jgi:hypothetical protein